MFEIVVNGVKRQFVILLPLGWEYWIQTLYDETGRDGLPLVLMLHGGGQDAATLLAQWPFHELQVEAVTDPWLQRFVLVVPVGASLHPKADGTPYRTWLAFDGNDLEPMPEVDDVTFIENAVNYTEGWMQAVLDQQGSARRPIDPDRTFGFAYSNGGMMLHRLVATWPDAFAAVWIQSATIGCKRYDTSTATVNTPITGDYAISAFFHHGDLDETVPPGATNAPSDYVLSEEIQTEIEASQVPAVDAEPITPQFRALRGAVSLYLARNNAVFGSFPTNDQSPNATTSEADLAGGDTSLKLRWNRNQQQNPVVIEYRDPEMGHTGFASSGHRYFYPADVWAWFQDHPRIQ